MRPPPASRALVRAAAGGALLLITAGTGLAAPENQNVLAEAIRTEAAATAPANATISLGTLAGAQYMQACTQPLSVTLSGTAPYEQASAHCPQPAWTLYVAVTVAAVEQVVVAARPIAAGAPLQAADLSLRNEPVMAFAGRQVFYDPAALSGATAAMSLNPGAIITASAISEPILVQAGQTVTVDVQSGGVDISVNAVADEAGRAGETILMTNPSSGQRFPALVTQAGVIVQLN